MSVTCCPVGAETDDAVHNCDCPTIDRTGERGYIDDQPAESTGRVIRWRPGPYMQDAEGHLWRADRGPYCHCEGCGLAYPRWNGDPCDTPAEQWRGGLTTRRRSG